MMKTDTNMGGPDRGGFTGHLRSALIILIILLPVLVLGSIFTSRKCPNFEEPWQTISEVFMLSTCVSFYMLVAVGLVILYKILSHKGQQNG